MWLVVLSIAALFYADADGDGYGDPATWADAPTAPTGYVTDDSDCDDADASVHPGVTDACDGVDNDCDGAADTGGDCPCDVENYLGRAYQFCDGVTAAWTTAEAACEADGYVLAVVGNAAEDAWFDAQIDARSTSKWWFGASDRATEGTWVWVDGSDALYTNWAKGEPNDAGSGEDCVQFNRYTDGTWNDEPCASAFRYVCEADVGVSTWSVDADGDGWGDPGSATITASDAPSGYADRAGDCDDGDGDVHPGVAEVCDGVDQDCDGVVDEGVGGVWYADADGDGFGDPGAAITACTAPPGTVATAGDCDDADAGVHPGVDESCDGVDEDCDGFVDEAAVDAPIWWADADGDGYGDAAVAARHCDRPAGFVDNDDDCDDTDASRHPGATQRPNGIDDDCDGVADDDPVDTDVDTDTDSDSDSDTPDDTDVNVDPDGEVPLPGWYAGGACGCDGVGAGGVAWLIAAAVVGRRRRR